MMCTRVPMVSLSMMMCTRVPMVRLSMMICTRVTMVGSSLMMCTRVTMICSSLPYMCFVYVVRDHDLFVYVMYGYVILSMMCLTMIFIVFGVYD